VIQVLYGKSLSKGDRGDGVADLQRRLNHLHFKVVGADDGIFGKNTEIGVIRCQDAYGLEQDGIVGPLTSKTALDPTDGQVNDHFNIFHDVLYSRGNGDLILRGELHYRLERLRVVCGNRPIICNSVYRDPVYNKILEKYGAAPNSQHMLGTAADIVIVGMTPAYVAVKARAVGFTFTLVYDTFTHVDIR
jgi:zinc D-Ala-D-Ala carboxypeptidase